jgi:predicted transcriptional regulator
MEDILRENHRVGIESAVLGYTTVGRVKINLMNEKRAVDALSYITSNGGSVTQSQLLDGYASPNGLGLDCQIYLEERELVRVTPGKDEETIDITEKGKKILQDSKSSAGMK